MPKAAAAYLAETWRFRPGWGRSRLPCQHWFTQHGARVTQTIDTRSILVAPSGRRLLAAVRAVGPGLAITRAGCQHPRRAIRESSTRARWPAGLVAGPGRRPQPWPAPRRPGHAWRHPVHLSRQHPGLAGQPRRQPAIRRKNLCRGFSACRNAAGAAERVGDIQPAGHSAAVEPQRLKSNWLNSATASPVSPGVCGKQGDAAPDLTRFVDQAALFMTLLGLAALLVGGIGVANGVEAWLTARARSIATLRCLGASARLVSLIYGLQLLVLGVPGILLGLAAGAAAPVAGLAAVARQTTAPSAYRPLSQAAAVGRYVRPAGGAGLRAAAAAPRRRHFRRRIVPPGRLPASVAALLAGAGGAGARGAGAGRPGGDLGPAALSGARFLRRRDAHAAASARHRGAADGCCCRDCRHRAMPPSPWGCGGSTARHRHCR